MSKPTLEAARFLGRPFLWGYGPHKMKYYNGILWEPGNCGWRRVHAPSQIAIEQNFDTLPNLRWADNEQADA